MQATPLIAFCLLPRLFGCALRSIASIIVKLTARLICFNLNGGIKDIVQRIISINTDWIGIADETSIPNVLIDACPVYAIPLTSAGEPFQRRERKSIGDFARQDMNLAA